MGVEVSVNPSVTQYYGTFDMAKLVKGIRGFLGSDGYDVLEPSYKHKVGGDGADVEIKMVSDRKATHYAKFKINVELKISDMKDVEVEKVKMQHGRVQVTVTGAVELDYQRSFESNAFLKGLREFYHRFIITGTIDNSYDSVHTSMFKLQRYIRDQLQFEAR